MAAAAIANAAPHVQATAAGPAADDVRTDAPLPAAAPAVAHAASLQPASGNAPAGTSPAAQVAPALAQAVQVQLGHAQGGAQHLTVRLDPVELGQVHVRIERAADGTTAVQVMAERPETLHMLLADKPQLQAALTNAGVQPGSHISVSLGTPDSGSGFGGSGGANPGSGQFGSQSGGQNGRQPSRPWASSPAAADGPTPTAWLRAGVDILA